MSDQERKHLEARLKVARRLAEKERQHRIAHPPKKKRRKRGTDKHRYSYTVTWKRFKEIKAEAERLGCSVNSLFDIMVESWMNPKVQMSIPARDQVREDTTPTKHSKETPAGYTQPAYFTELKRAIAARNKKRKGG